jgi:hypothetical protein
MSSCARYCAHGASVLQCEERQPRPQCQEITSRKKKGRRWRKEIDRWNGEFWRRLSETGPQSARFATADYSPYDPSCFVRPLKKKSLAFSTICAGSAVTMDANPRNRISLSSSAEMTGMRRGHASRVFPRNYKMLQLSLFPGTDSKSRVKDRECPSFLPSVWFRYPQVIPLSKGGCDRRLSDETERVPQIGARYLTHCVLRAAVKRKVRGGRVFARRAKVVTSV